MGWAYHIITSIVSQLWADLVLVVTIPWNYIMNCLHEFRSCSDKSQTLCGSYNIVVFVQAQPHHLEIINTSFNGTIIYGECLIKFRCGKRNEWRHEIWMVASSSFASPNPTADHPSIHPACCR